MNEAGRRRVLALLTAGALVLGLAVSPAVATEPPAVAADTLAVVDLRVDNAVAPLGVGTDRPQFGWQLTTDTRAVLQTSYRVQVASSEAALATGEADVWDSGEVASDRVSDIEYAGPGLGSDTRYYWRVRATTDRAGAAWSPPSHFATALLDDADKTAQWIGAPGDSSEDWADYTVEADVQIVDETATLYLRAHGAANAYMWQLAAGDDGMTFRPHVRLNGGYTLLGEVPVPTSVVPADAVKALHHLKITAQGSTITTWLDWAEIDRRTDTAHGAGNIGFRATASERARFSNVTVVEVPSGTVLFDHALDANPFSAGSIGADGLTVANASPILRAPGSQAWTDYRVDVTFRIVDEAATLYLRSDADGANSYMWQLNAAEGDGRLLFKPHQRVGGGYAVLDAVPIDPAIVPSDELDSEHRLTVELVGNTVTTSVDGQQIDERDVTAHAAGTIGFRQSASERAVFTDLQVTAPDDEVLAASPLRDEPVFAGGSYVSGALEIQGADVMMLVPGSRTPLVRTEFTLDQDADDIARATLFSTAKGVYAARLNGADVNDDHLSPGSSDYRDRFYYQSTDVAGLLRSGANALGAQLSPGWYAGSVGWFGPNQFGSLPQFWAQLQITYADGSTQTVGTDDGWTIGDGGLLAADLLDGETFDARAEPAGWDEPGFDATGWSPVGAAAAEPARLVAQIGPTVRPLGEITPVARTEVSPGVYVFDLGQEISGVVRLTADGPTGQTITLRHAQDVQPDGTLYRANLTAGDAGLLAQQTDVLTLDGSGATTWEPRHTYHGFRYVEVSGYPGVPEPADVVGVSLGSELTPTGSLRSGDAMLDQLQSNIAWSLKNNLVSIPTDTNARAERLGWAGDATFSADVATYNYDVEEFYRKWMHDLAYTQTDDGLVSNVAPALPRLSGGYGGGWGDAIVAIPYASWQRYGDTSIVAENYEAMKKWLLFLESHSDGSYLLGDDMGPAGDWMNAGEGTPGWFTATTYFGWDAMVLEDMARALGKDEDADRFADIHARIARALVDAGHVRPDGSIGPDTQAAYVMALHADLVPDALRTTAADRLVANIEARGLHVSTGFAATGWVLPVLTETGHADVAYGLLQQESYPSWGYMVESGATTIWERWNFILPDTGGFHPQLNGSSPDHAVFGSVGSWMYDRIGGIVGDPEHPGYREFHIDPQPGGTVTRGSGSFESRYGTISTDWAVRDGGFDLDAVVPAGSTATVSVPVAAGQEVREGDRPAADAEGVTYLHTERGRAYYRVGSGSYSFVVGDPVGAPALSASAGAAVYGRAATVTVVAPDGVDGTVEVSERGRVVARGRMADGSAAVQLPRTGFVPGRHLLDVTMVGGTSAPTTVVLRVAKAPTTTRLARVTKRIVVRRTRATAVLTVRAPGVTVGSGTVRVTRAGRPVGRAEVRRGTVRVRLRPFAHTGRRVLVVRYAGNRLVAPSSTRFVVVVRRR